MTGYPEEIPGQKSASGTIWVGVEPLTPLKKRKLLKLKAARNHETTKSA